MSLPRTQSKTMNVIADLVAFPVRYTDNEATTGEAQNALHCIDGIFSLKAYLAKFNIYPTRIKNFVIFNTAIFLNTLI